MKLRPVTKGDMEIASHFLREMIQEMAAGGGDPLRDEMEIHKWFEQSLESALEHEDHLVLLAQNSEPDSEPIGLVEASLTELHPLFARRRLLHIHAIYVEPGYRRQGIGRQLMQAAMRWGREQGCAQIALSVLAGNPASKFYEALGFEVFELEMRRNL
jgi:ribosomal protein S18 acetylase RimI-like enzyme